MAAQQQQLGLRERHTAQNPADFSALFGGGVKLFGSGRRGEAEKSSQALIALAARLTAKLIQADANRGAKQPGLQLLVLLAITPRRGVLGQLEEHLYRQFLRARRVTNHACDYPSNPLVLMEENGFQIEIRIANPGITRQRRRNFARSVHKTITPLVERL